MQQHNIVDNQQSTQNRATMLSHDVIKYNIAEYLTLEDVDKLPDDVFWNYADKDPNKALDYLCSIRDEERLVYAFNKYNIDIADFYQRCWSTSGAHIDFMGTLYGYYPPKSTVTCNVLVDFLNGNYVHTITLEEIYNLLDKLPNKYSFYDKELSMSLIPFIEKFLEYQQSMVAFNFYTELDFDVKVRILTSLRQRQIQYIDIFDEFCGDECKKLYDSLENPTKDEIWKCLRSFLGNNTDRYCDILINPNREHDYQFIQTLRRAYVDAPDDRRQYCLLDKPDHGLIKYNFGRR